MGVDAGIIRKAGAWFTYGNDQLGQGKENARTFLIAHPEVADEIDGRIRVALGLAPDPDVPENVDPETGELREPAEG
jgi:recombination protein RecA